MGENEFQIGLVAKLDGTKSRNQINADIAAIKKSIEEIDVTVKLDKNTVSSIEGQLKNIKISPVLDPAAITRIRGQLKAALQDIKIDIGNNSAGKTNVFNDLTNQAKSAGANVGDIISKSAQQAINQVSSKSLNQYFKIDEDSSKDVEREMEALVNNWTNKTGKLQSVKISTKTDFNDDLQERITKLDKAVVTYKNNMDEVITKTLEWSKIGSFETDDGKTEDIFGFTEVKGNFSKALDEMGAKTETFTAKVKNAVTSFKNDLDTQMSKALDKNAAKPILREDSINQINAQKAVVESAIATLESSSSATFTDASNAVDREINKLKILSTELRNAESAATDFRTKPIEVIRDETLQKVQQFEAELKKSSGDTSELSSKVEQMKKSLTNVSDANGIQKVLNDLALAKAELGTINKEFSVNETLSKTKIKAEQKLNELNSFAAATDELNTFETTVQDSKVTLESLREELSNIAQTGTGSLSVVTEKMRAFLQNAEKAGTSVKQLTNELDKFKENRLQGILDNYTNNIYGETVDKLNNRFNNYGMPDSKIDKNIEDLSTAYQKLGSAVSSYYKAVEKGESQSELDKKIALIKEAEAEYAKLAQATNKQVSLVTTTNASKNDIQSLINDLNNFKVANSNISKEARKNIDDYIADLESRLSQGTATAKSEISKIRSEFKNLETAERQAGRLGLSVWDSFKQGAKKFTSWIGMTTIVMKTIQQFKNMVASVTEVDTAMTSLYKVTDETSAKYNEFLNKSYDNAQKLGKSVSDLIEQTASWAKLGYSLDESSTLAQVSSIYANVGELSNEDAVSDLVTAMKAFNIESTDAITIVDKLNKLGNEFATSSADLGEGLKRSASMMAMGGNSLEQTLAMITGGAEITQNADELANALRIGQMRVQGMKGALEELGEEVDEDIDSISKMQTHILNLTSGKVNIFNDAGGFRTYYDILQDISEIIDELSDTDRADLIETLFGKNRANQGMSVIKAFQSGQVQKAFEAANNADGSAMKEQERWLESIEAKTQQFRAAFQKLSNDFVSSDFIKKLIDGGTDLLNVLDWAINKLGTLKSLLALIAGIVMSQKNLGRLKRLTLVINMPKHRVIYMAKI